MKKIFVITAVLVLSISSAFAGDKVKMGVDDVIISNHDVRIVNLPTAYTLPRGSYMLNLRLYNNGGLFTYSYFSFSEKFLFGVFMNTSNVIGSKKVIAGTPKIMAKLKLLDQKNSLPAMAVGYNSIIEVNGEKSDKEFYLAASRKFAILSGLLVHAGAYTSTLSKIKMSDVHYYAGITKNFERGLGLFAEVRDPLDVNGYSVNAGVKYNFSPELELELIFRSLNTANRLNREIGVSYSNYF